MIEFCKLCGYQIRQCLCGPEFFVPPPGADDTRYKSSEDIVNKPEHYQLPNGIEVIDIIEHLLTEEEYKGYLKGNVLKYTLRADRKGKSVEDRKKSMKYTEWLLEKEGKDGTGEQANEG